jgi:1,4-alpha-glucan branching enzyme
MGSMTLSDLDLYLLSQGRHERLWDVLGAHPVAGGTDFAVWAPNAQAVLVDGEFTGWDLHGGVELKPQGPSGVWTGYAEGARKWQRYKYRILGADGQWQQHADPMATHSETPPASASVIFDSGYSWDDGDWMAARRGDHHARPMSVYEVHLASWRPGLSYVDLADQLVTHVRNMGFTHVELMPVMEHPFGGSWGYQVTGFFAPTARLGNPDDLRYLIDTLHRNGIGVLLDWVPAHFPKDAWALARFDGTPLYEHPDPRRGEHPDWGSLIFDYGRPEVRNFLLANALYWLEEFHADGLRVDAVSSMLFLDYSRGPGQWEPNVNGGNENLEAVAFLRDLNELVYRTHPGVVMIAEESAAWPGVSRPTNWGGLGFGIKWNMGWMHDTLDYFTEDPVNRRWHHNTLTLPTTYAFTENFLLPLSHDEVVHGKRSLAAKMPGDRWQRVAGLRGLLAYQWAFPGKQLLFMGAELAQETEWSEQRGLDWNAAFQYGATGVAQLLGDMNRVYRASPALWSQDTTPAGFGWITSDADANVLAFLRWGSKGEALACVCNFAGTPISDYRIGLPLIGDWVEVLNTDAGAYGGSGVGNLGSVHAVAQPLHGHPASAPVTVGAYAVAWFKPA